MDAFELDPRLEVTAAVKNALRDELRYAEWNLDQPTFAVSAALLTTEPPYERALGPVGFQKLECRVSPSGRLDHEFFDGLTLAAEHPTCLGE
jgi:hypothetical protein